MGSKRFKNNKLLVASGRDVYQAGEAILLQSTG
jgi:hypothetical protein